ncbi:MAG: CHAT domain-containing protein [Gammaproteobacteria bacterium]|nr:CHAT domain-containing protein [Gammaproteobacteria bacterium]
MKFLSRKCLALVLSGLVAAGVPAEVVLDGTLGKKGALPGPLFDVQSNMGQQAGGNLFHSFASFNLRLDEAAKFSGPVAVENIISRVTGGETSHIDGKLISEIAGADMYFLNPAGVMFGPNARLEVQGSLHVSTADYLRLGDSGRFDALHPEISVLTVASPAAFGFLRESPGNISKQDSFLKVPDGKTLSFIGGNLDIEDRPLVSGDETLDRYMAASDGQINLVSVASSGEVPAIPETMPDTAFSRFGAITIKDDTKGEDNFYRGRASIDVSGAGGGRVFIRGGKVMLDNAYVFADTLGGKNGQGIEIKADDLALRNGTRITTQAVAKPGSTGNAGNIIVNANRVTLHQAKITSTSDTPGAAGNIHITAGEKVDISELFLGFSSGLSTAVSDIGKGGEIIINAPLLTVRNGTDIRADTQGDGNAGDITVRVDTLHLESGGQLSVTAGGQKNTSSEKKGSAGILKITAKEAVLISGREDKDRPSALLGNTFMAGDGGSIVIKAPLVEVEEHAAIQAGTSANGKGGDISLEAETLRVRDDAEITTESFGSGNAGQILINASRLSLHHEGRIESATADAGSGGGITIHAGSVSMHNAGSRISTETNGPGKGGVIAIDVDELVLSNGAEISAASGESGVTAENQGEAGRITMRVEDSLRMRGGSGIKTSTLQADGGNVEIASSGYLYLTDSEITTSVQTEEGNGGNIGLTPEFIVLDGSRIKADASKGKGGNVAITATGVYNFSGEPIKEVITASSQFGLDGTVTINAPDVNEEKGVTLPVAFLSARQLLPNRCGIYASPRPSRFVAKRHTGKLAMPDDWLASRFLPVDLDLPATAAETAALRALSPEACNCPAGQKKFPQHDGTLIQRALMYSYQGDLCLTVQKAEIAMDCLDQGLAIAGKLNNPLVSAHLLNNRGNVSSVQEAYAKAANDYTQAMELAERTGDIRLRIQTLSNGVRLHLKDDSIHSPFSQSEEGIDRSSAVAALNKALLLARSLPDGDVKSFYLLNLGELAFRVHKRFPENRMLGNVYRALSDAYENAKNSPGSPKRLMAYARGYLGSVYAHERRYAEALLLTREAIFLAQKQPDLLYRWEWQRGRLLEQNDLKGAAAAYRLAISYLQPIRGEFDIGRRDTRAMFYEHIRPVYFDLTDLLLRQARDTSGEKKQQLLIQARDTLELLKAAELEDYFQDPCVARVTKLAPPDKHTAVLYPIMLANRTELLLSLPDGIHLAEVPADTKTLERTALAFRKNLQEGRRRFINQAWQLYEWLIEPMHPMLLERKINTLVIVPDGPLRTIPFAAFHNGDNKFLVEEFALAITPGLKLTGELRRLPRQNIEVLLNGLSEGVRDFSPLPHAFREIKSLEDLFDKRMVLLNKEFTLDSIKRNLQTTPYSIVHIASHGQFDRDPQKTFLLTYDDKLSMDRLERLLSPGRSRDKPVELLTLSACQTAAGDERAALGLAGVAVKAGARSAVASLWSVNDQFSSQLMLEFYRQLLQNRNLSKAQALRSAQRKLLQRRDPVDWAPFLLIGNWL